MIYDKQEATRILAQSHARRDPFAHSERRKRAVKDLILAILDAAKEAGYEVSKSGVTDVVAHPRKGLVGLPITNNEEGFSLWLDPEWKTTMEQIAIEYDAAAGAFVGKEFDSFFVPEPGQPRRRRSAVAVVAEEIAKLLDGKAAADRVR